MLIWREARATYTSAVGEKPGVVISRPLSGTRGLRDGTTATTSDPVSLLRWGPQVLHTRRRELSILVLWAAPWMPFWEVVSENTGRAAACAQVPDYRRLYTRSGKNSGDMFYVYNVIILFLRFRGLYGLVTCNKRRREVGTGTKVMPMGRAAMGPVSTLSTLK